MKINIVMGFFLPVPPAAGGATEKSWHRLATEFATRGHAVTVISRRWPGWPDRETIGGVQHLRLPGFDHRRKLWQNLALDLRWSLRVQAALPAADLTVVNAVTLPCWLARSRPAAGRVVVMPGRMPKGQFRLYRGLARVLATSTPVRDRVLAENPALAGVTRIFGYPIAWDGLALPPRPVPGNKTVLGYVGRLHREKGLDLFVEACARLAARPLPPWRVLLSGPVDVARGGSGPAYRDGLAARLAQCLPADRFTVADATFDEAALARRYREIDVFCYPSLAAQGETFGVAVAEAMAAGAAPVVSDLACFRDFVHEGANGLVFDHTAPDAPDRLADRLAALVYDPDQRLRLAAQGQSDVRRYDFPVFADRLLADFASLLSPLDHASAVL